MTTVLTAAEAARVLRLEASDGIMLDLLPQVDAYLEQATGRDWTGDDPIHSQAKVAARILLVRWYEDPGALANEAVLGLGFSAALTQLEALALELETTGAPDSPLKLVRTNIQGDMAVGASLVLVFSHALASGATGLVTLASAAGASVTVTNNLDATSKILTVNPDSDLNPATSYQLSLDDVPDAYGRTLATEIGFTTA